jgi:hypothetical protein
MVKTAQGWQGKHAPYALGTAWNPRPSAAVRTALSLLVYVEQMTEMLLAK